MENCSMVILNYKDSKRAKTLALKCSEYLTIDHIVIVDNCSNDGSFEDLSKIKNEKIDVISSERNGGFSFGNNCGAKYLIDKYNSKYILFANTDTIFPENNIISCIQYLENDYLLGLISTRMKGIDNIEQKSFWRYSTYWNYISSCFWIFRRKKRNLITTNDEFMYVDVVRGSFMLFKTEALIKADFFDDNVFLYAEEVIISRRLQRVGYKVGLLNNLFYIHNHIDVVKTTKGYNSLKKMYESIYYYQCNYEKINIIKKVLLKFCMKYALMEQKVIDTLKEFKEEK